MGTENLKPASEALELEPQEAIQHEDAALKTAFRYFSDVLLPYFGIQKKAVEITATELVHLDVKISRCAVGCSLSIQPVYPFAKSVLSHSCVC